jgi:hypothetical protein
MTTTETRESLRNTDGFVIESPDGDLGWVEEVWIGEESEPEALAIRTIDGRHGLLLGDAVLAVDRENHWVVVPAEPPLLELASPHLTGTSEGRDGTVLKASWETTGRHLSPVPRRPRFFRYLERRLRRRRRRTHHERPLWQAVATLVSTLILAVIVVVALAFLIADLVTGAPY